jgi:CheY-like chemotaxis protein
MKTILLIEDNKDIRENATEMLELEGYKTISASNGQIGLQLAIEQLPDLILSDILMPVMTGFELFKELRNDERTKHIPFIIISASIEERNLTKGMEGIDGFIIKPFEEKELFETIESILKK